MYNIFDSSRQIIPERSVQDLSNNISFDYQNNWLVPIGFYDCIPGDRFSISSKVFVRMEALLKPAFTKLKGKTRSFFVPYRILWDDWSRFFTGGRTGDNYPPLPCIDIRLAAKSGVNSFFDYFKLPCNVKSKIASAYYISALYFLAYIKIWNDYFRNPSIDIEIDVIKRCIYLYGSDTPIYPANNTTFNGSYPLQTYPDGSKGENISFFIYVCLLYMQGSLNSDYSPDFNALLSKMYSIINSPSPITSVDSTVANSDDNPLLFATADMRPAMVNLYRDMFTSALPTPQLGTAPTIPVNVNGNLSGSGNSIIFNNSSTTPDYLGSYDLKLSNAGSGYYNVNVVQNTVGGHNANNLVVKNDDVAKNLVFSSSLSAGFYVRQMRITFAKQLRGETLLYSGTRYVDALKGMFGVAPDDKTSDMAQFIGGYNFDIHTSEVLQTSESGTTPQGTLAGHGIGGKYNFHGKKFIDEFGCVISFFYINKSNIYSQGIRRDFLKNNIYDFVMPMFVNIGEREIKNIELFYSGVSNTDNATFGFTGMYNDYRYVDDYVCGGIRNTKYPWAQSRKFNTTPVLNSSFIKTDFSSDNQIFGTANVSMPYLVDVINDVKAFRPLPAQSIAGLIDHLGV